MICHGQGDQGVGVDLFEGGCCFVAGAVCPLRWFIDYSTSSPAGDVGTATILDSNRQSLGTVFDYVENLMPGGGPNKAARVQRVLDQVQGTIFVCSAAATVIGLDPKLINDRVAFEEAMTAEPSYAPIGDYWVSIGKPFDWCPKYGPSEGQCCYGEDQATRRIARAICSLSSRYFANRCIRVVFPAPRKPPIMMYRDDIRLNVQRSTPNLQR